MAGFPIPGNFLNNQAFKSQRTQDKIPSINVVFLCPEKMNMAFRRLFLFSVFAVIFLPGRGQEMLGTVLGNYSGINSPQLNPSAMSGSKVYLDVNLLGLDLFVQNNYIYIDQKDYRFSHFFQSSYEYPQHSELYGTSDRMFYHYPGKDFRQAYVNLRINGPGAMLAWGEHTFALTTAVRSVSTVFYSPYEIANFAYLGLNYKPQHNINFQDKRFFSTATLTWAEIGLSYSYPVYAMGLNMISLGVSIRRLEGIAGGYLYSRDANYIVPDDSTIIVKNLDVHCGYALPLNYDNNQPEMGKLFKGGGFAGDIGVTLPQSGFRILLQFSVPGLPLPDRAGTDRCGCNPVP
jgi:hypothetical protein